MCHLNKLEQHHKRSKIERNLVIQFMLGLNNQYTLHYFQSEMRNLLQNRRLISRIQTDSVSGQNIYFLFLASMKPYII